MRYTTEAKRKLARQCVLHSYVTWSRHCMWVFIVVFVREIPQMAAFATLDSWTIDVTQFNLKSCQIKTELNFDNISGLKACGHAVEEWQFASLEKCVVLCVSEKKACCLSSVGQVWTSAKSHMCKRYRHIRFDVHCGYFTILLIYWKYISRLYIPRSCTIGIYCILWNIDSQTCWCTNYSIEM